MLRGCRDLKGLREPMKASEDLWGYQRASESLDWGLKWLENLQNDLGVNNYYFKIFKELSEDLNLRLRGAKKGFIGSWRWIKWPKNVSRVLQDIGPVRAAALYCITKNHKFTVHKYAMNTWVRVYILHDWSWVPKLRECQKWSKNEILFLLP